MDKNMPTVFTASTKITILFTGWTTSTTTQYTFTLIFIFLLAILNRFLGALKSQLELSWSQDTAHHQINQKSKHSPIPEYLNLPEDDREERYLPVSVDHDTRNMSVGLLERVTSRSFQKRFVWKASGAWTPWKDGPRALLEGARAVSGYFL